jgi:hypothetical protein
MVSDTWQASLLLNLRHQNHSSPAAKVKEVDGMKGPQGAMRTPDEEVLVVFKLRQRPLLGPKPAA